MEVVCGGGWWWLTVRHQSQALCLVEDVGDGGRCVVEDGVWWRILVVNCQTPVTGPVFSQ